MNDAIDVHKIECDVTFLAASAEGWGKPKKPILNGNWYRPHLVVGDPNQRKALVGTRTFEIEHPDGSKSAHTSDRSLIEDYAGISFDSGPDAYEFGIPLRIKLSLMFWPGPQYGQIKRGATFTVREGATVVGFGTVLSDIFVEAAHRTPHP